MSKYDCGVCAGCIGMGPCDDGYPCQGGGCDQMIHVGQMCGSCERDSLGLDEEDTDDGG